MQRAKAESLGVSAQYNVLTSFINEKCRRFLQDETLYFPVMLTPTTSTAFYVRSSKSAITFINSVMFSYLSQIPLGKVSYSVCDIEGQGNNIRPFFDIKKELPDLFNDGIFTTSESVKNCLSGINCSPNGWYAISYGSRTAYVSGDYVLEVSFDELNSGQVGIIHATTDVNIRSGPGTEYSRVGELGDQQKAIYVGYTDGWYKIIIHQGQHAYISGDYVDEDYISWS